MAYARQRRVCLENDFWVQFASGGAFGKLWVCCVGASSLVTPTGLASLDNDNVRVFSERIVNI